MAIEVTLEKFKGQPATIAHNSGDSHRMDSNLEWRKVKRRVFRTLDMLQIEDIQIVVRGQRAGKVADSVRRIVERLERPTKAQIRKS